MLVPTEPKIYHIVHVDRLSSIIGNGYLWCDAKMAQRSGPTGTAIGMASIKDRRLKQLTLTSHPGLHVGDCVPFYFCPRSVMLYVIRMANHPELTYQGGQSPILHLETDLRQTVAWTDANRRRWAFTSSNAGSRHFDDYADLRHLDKLDWDAIHAKDWVGEKQDGKQAEFLMEQSFPWTLITGIGVLSAGVRSQTLDAMAGTPHHPTVEIRRDWYY